MRWLTSPVPAASVLLTLALGISAHFGTAVGRPYFKVFPTCQIDPPRPDERTTVIYVKSGAALSSVTIGGDDVITEVVDVEIAPAEKPHYIVLSSGKPIIWRFTGRRDTISRIIVLGSQYTTASRSGVIGVPRDRIVFAKPTMDEAAAEKLQWKSLASISKVKACEASTYFSIPKAFRMQLAGEEPSTRFAVDQFVERLKADTIRIPQDGWVEREVPTSGPGWVKWPGPSLGRHELFAGEGHARRLDHHGRIVEINAADVTSPEIVRDYVVLPGAEGLKQLMASGAIVGPADPLFKATYAR